MPKAKTEETAPLEEKTDVKSIVNMDSLSSKEELPAVQEHAIAAVQAEIEASENGFDPDIHATDKDGKPKKTASGDFAKKRGRKSTVNTGEKSKKQIEKEQADEKARAENKQSAVVISGILEQAQIKLISEDFKYSDIEREANRAVWEATIEYYGGLDIPPPIALMIDHMTIILVRAQKESVKDKFTLARTWFKTKFKRKSKKNALSDTRTDAKRENDVREEEGSRA